MRNLLIAAALAGALLGGVAQGAILTEDFQVGGDPAVPGFDPAFNHQIALPEFGGIAVYSSFSTSRFTSPSHSLLLAPATDYVTFNLSPGEYVDYAEVWMVSAQDNPPAYWHVIGTEGDLLQHVGSGSFTKFDTSSANLGAITEIRLTGYEGYFDDLRINVVPEPATLLLLATGTALLARRRRRRLVVLALAPLLLFALAAELSADVHYGPGESPSGYQPQPPPPSMSPPGSEQFDIIFVIDGSGSFGDGLGEKFELEKWGVRHTFFGDYAFLPTDGTVAIAVVEFSDAAQVRIPLTVIDTPARAEALDTQVGNIGLIGGGTDLKLGLQAAVDQLTTGVGNERLIVASTDSDADSTSRALDRAEEIRSGTGYAQGLGQTRICSVLIDLCADPPDQTDPGDSVGLRKLANTADSSGTDAAGRTYPRPNQPIGHFSCAYDNSLPIDLPPIQDFVSLCNECSCSIIHAGETDCQPNGVPDVCEPACGISGQPPLECDPTGDADGDGIQNQDDNCPCTSNPDQADCDGDGVGDACETDPNCNHNQWLDNCEIAQGLADDCQGDGVPDDCQLSDNDCNGNGVPDECDFDWNGDGCADDCPCICVHRVDWQAPGPTHDGQSWETAFTSLQDALAATYSDCQIWVAAGTYTPAPPNGDRSLSFQMHQRVQMYGGFAGYYGASEHNTRDPKTFVTVLSGDLNGDDQPGFINNGENSYQVVTCDNLGTDWHTLLDGFTITGGNANGSTDYRGGGIAVWQSGPRINGCLITGNHAAYAGGLAVWGPDSEPTISNCVFTDNEALAGGAASLSAGLPHFVNCTIAGNNATMQCGGLRIETATGPTMANSIVWENTDDDAGTDTLAANIQLVSGGALAATYSCVQDNDPNDANIYPGTGNIDDDPLLATGGSLALTARSPAIDAGNNALVPADPPLLHNKDFAWRARFLDDPDVTDAGVGSPPIVDMGAWEYDINTHDCNGNGFDDTDDVVNGRSDDCNGNLKPDECERDCDGDGSIDDCDPDDDNDGVSDDQDNCPCGFNPDQADCDGDGIGDVCDPTPHALMDYDKDCDVDQDDFGIWQACVTDDSTQVDPNSACANKDLNGDLHVTASDLGLFLYCLKGPAVVVDGNCGDCNGDGISDAAQDFDGDGLPDGDVDHDGVPFNGLPPCTTGQTTGCSDNCPCVANNTPGIDVQNDADGDGLGDACDNCPTVYNPDQANTYGGSSGDACEPPPAPPPPDADGDGIPDSLDNCPYVANSTQTDADADGLGDACDNCPAVANADQEDSDWDGVGDACTDDDDGDGVPDAQDHCRTWFNPANTVPTDCNHDGDTTDPGEGVGEQCDSDGDGAGDECDTCPDVYNPDQSNQDGDWWQDACDNCPNVPNYYQQDADGDGVGDACDNCPSVYNPDQADADQNGIGDACEGEGLLAGQQMMMTLEGGGLEPGAAVSASFVQHGTGAVSVVLPPEGGTVVVDLVLANSVPVVGFTAKPAASASGVVSVDTSGWTEQNNALFSMGDPGTSLPSYYNFGLLDWYVAIPSLAALDQTPRPPHTGVVTGRALGQISMGEVVGIAEGLDAVGGALSTPAGGVFTSAAPLGGCLKAPLSTGPATVATLTLQVAGAPGTYTLGIVDGTCSTDTGDTSMETGMPFTITVQGQ